MTPLNATNPIAALVQSQGHWIVHLIQFFVLLLCTSEIDPSKSFIREGCVEKKQYMTSTEPNLNSLRTNLLITHGFCVFGLFLSKWITNETNNVNLSIV